MARPKTRSALVDGISELVDSLRSIQSQLNALTKNQKKSSRGPGRPAGSGRGPGRPAKKGKRGRPAGSGRGPGRPRKPGRPASGGRKRRGRGRPPGSKNKAK